MSQNMDYMMSAMNLFLFSLKLSASPTPHLSYFVNSISQNIIPVVPHKAAAEVSKIGWLLNDVSQSELTDGPTSGWRQRSVVGAVVVLELNRKYSCSWSCSGACNAVQCSVV